MSVFNWFNKVFGIDNSISNIDQPTSNSDDKNNNHINSIIKSVDSFENVFEESIDSFKDIFEKSIGRLAHTNFEDILKQFELTLPSTNEDNMNANNFINVHMYENETDIFEESIHIFHKSLEEMLNHFDSKYSMIDNEDPNSFINYSLETPGVSNQNSYTRSICPISLNSEDCNQCSNEEECKKIPKKNIMARNYFLNPDPPVRTLNQLPINGKGFHFETSSTTSRSGTFNGRIIEKESSTRRLQNGIIEKVTIMKDGNEKCITTITEDLQTGEKNCNKKLVNLDESQLNEFESRFSKFM